ncbi:Delta-9 acyl-lipid desaturase 2, partial [Cucurbita argyrosperma subsp. sororia]
MGTSKQESKHMAKPEMPFCSRKWTNREKLVTVTFSIIHILCIFAPFQFTWNAFWVAVALYVISGLFGITISYHRNLSHRSFNLPKWLEYLFAYCGTHAFQGDPIDWVSTHRCHHQNADTERDPHSPTQGFWFSYLIWFLDSITLTNKVCPEYFIDRKDTKRGVFTLVLKVLCVLRWLSLMSFGEAWHNNHHAFEYSARIGIEWWQLDLGWYVIWFLQTIGVATDVKQPSESHKQRLAMDKPNEGVSKSLK